MTESIISKLQRKKYNKPSRDLNMNCDKIKN